MRHILPLLLVAGIVAQSVASGQDEGVIQAGEFSFSYDKPWIRQAVSSSMRAGQLVFRQSDENLEDVELVFFYFGPGGAGGIDANIDRWAGQFKGEAETKTEKKEVNGREIIYFTGKGNFQESMGGPFSGNTVDRPGYMMLAAILPGEKGGPAFLKMTGPEASMLAAREAFVRVAESALQE